MHQADAAIIRQRYRIVLHVRERGVFKRPEGLAQLASRIPPAPDEALREGSQERMGEIELAPARNRPAKLTHQQRLDAQ